MYGHGGQLHDDNRLTLKLEPAALLTEWYKLNGGKTQGNSKYNGGRENELLFGNGNQWVSIQVTVQGKGSEGNL
jgi:hypothetical protein